MYAIRSYYAWGQSEPAAANPASAKQQALQAYAEGKRAFGEGHFEEALSSFRSSYAALASPNSHLMIGKSLAEMGRLVDAYES